MTKFQKEKLRQERQREKAEKRAQKKNAKPGEQIEAKPLEITTDENGEVVGFDFHDF
jgi:hypothetical protein